MKWNIGTFNYIRNTGDRRRCADTIKKAARCNQCCYYEGVHNVRGHAPCAVKNIGVMWDDNCDIGISI